MIFIAENDVVGKISQVSMIESPNWVFDWTVTEDSWHFWRTSCNIGVSKNESYPKVAEFESHLLLESAVLNLRILSEPTTSIKFK